ncbi:GNAT family N-acetyltransferase [Undibacterium sp. TJN25]|uniref:GNAT family N-acetyltransferase n=1 Tax=Undibacterium sp. TJN25 TaxID=3413056 RepID=UPI003BF38601
MENEIATQMGARPGAEAIGHPGLPSAVEVRIAHPSDAELACNIIRRSISESCQRDHRDDPRILSRWLGNKSPGTIASWFASSGNYSLVAGTATEIVGVGLLTGAGKIALCYVKPELQLTGVGRALLQRMESRAREWQLPFVTIDSTVTARDFYLRQGYLEGRSGEVKSGIRAVSLWKYLDGNLTCAPNGQRPCNCALARQ